MRRVLYVGAFQRFGVEIEGSKIGVGSGGGIENWNIKTERVQFFSGLATSLDQAGTGRVTRRCFVGHNDTNSQTLLLMYPPPICCAVS